MMPPDSAEDEEKIGCLLCDQTYNEDSKMPMEHLKEHIAESHFSYIRHKCYTCRVKSFNLEKMFHHASDEPTHRIILNQVGAGSALLNLSIHPATPLLDHSECLQGRAGGPDL